MSTTLIQHALRYQVLHYAPGFARHSLSQNCLRWLLKNHVSVDWCLHLHILQWLALRHVLTPPLSRELLTAAAIRWGLEGLEHVQARGILLYSDYLIQEGIGLWKNQDLVKMPRLVRVRLPSLGVSLCYTISQQEGIWDTARWFYLPKIEYT